MHGEDDVMKLCNFALNFCRVLLCTAFTASGLTIP